MSSLTKVFDMPKNDSMVRRCMIAGLVACICPIPASFAQSIPSAGQQLNQMEQQQLQQSLPQDIPEVTPEESAPVQRGNQTVKIQVNRFQFQGALTLADEQALQALLAHTKGKRLNFNELEGLTRLINHYFSDRGYKLSHATLPPQDITDGVITIQIHEVRLDDVDVEGHDLRIPEELIKRRFTSANPVGGLIADQKVERGVLLLQDLPGIKPSVNMAAGSKPDTTKMVLDVEQGDLLKPKLFVDNGGNRLTGRVRMMGLLDVNSALKRGDQLSLNIMKSMGEGYFNYASMNANLPVGDSGWKVSVGGNLLSYRAGGSFETLRQIGHAAQLTLGASYPLLLNRSQTLNLTTGFVYKKLDDESLGSATNDKKLAIFKAGMNGSVTDTFWRGGFTSGSMSYEVGDLDLSGLTSAYDADQSSTGPHAHGGYGKLSVRVRRIQRAGKNLTFLADLSGQYASKNLSTSEKFQLGGPSGIRAYPVGEASGDHGMMVNLNARYLAAEDTPLGRVQLTAFYDWGNVHQYADPDNLVLSTPNSYSLSGYGLGVLVGTAGKSEFNLQLTRTLGDHPGRDSSTNLDGDGTQYDTRMWLSYSHAF
ncbi:Polypeptide-transport-associated domain protein, ShlB-type [Magnetococcus marinus MC-1]|uniref:Polypeptide-transport-associated domain protein, ShlB-type n=2 Tax=Magnetococcus TaxID=162171 RepID=A0LB48_MAGMM|nr:Polypeptide-transport-associated domain protein, ShlB-type [Magnetococcus marinus MC-1]